MKLYSLRSLIEIVGISPGFIKRLEETELIHPIVEKDGTFYTERDLRKLFLAKDLREMGINFAGIEVILEISDRMFAMKKESDEILYKLLKYVDQNIIEKKY
jgi:DNA-binding transcriptional MerR regulator